MSNEEKSVEKPINSPEEPEVEPHIYIEEEAPMWATSP